MTWASGSLRFTGLSSVFADHLQVSIEAPESHFLASGLGSSRDQKVDCRATMAAVRSCRQISLNLQRALYAFIREWQALKRGEESIELLPYWPAVSGRCIASRITGTQVTISPDS